MNIYPLSQYPEEAETCAAWSFGSWGCHTKGNDIYKSINGYKERAESKGDNVPLTWIGKVEHKIIGMISLVECDHEDRKDLTPWLASMYIFPMFRKKGYASKLIQHLHQEAKKLGYNKLYLYTPDAEKLYLKNGWKIIDTVRDPRGLREFDQLMEIDLKNV